MFALNRSPEVSPCYQAYSELRNVFNFTSYSPGPNFSPSLIVDLCKQEKISKIVNFASQSMVAESWEDPWDWYETNAVWLSKITSEIIKWGKIRLFLHFSTPEVYGNTGEWILEDAPYNPSTPYAISRMAGDLHLKAEFLRTHFPIIITRTANVYGPHQTIYRLIPKALLRASRNESFSIHGDGSSIRSFIFMEDVAEALLRIIERGSIGNVYHISTKETATVKEIVEICYRSFGLEPEGKLDFISDRHGKDKAYLLDSNKIRQELSWKDKITLVDGIKRTKMWLEQNASDLEKQQQRYIHKI